jgi:hypothetical protein
MTACGDGMSVGAWELPFGNLSVERNFLDFQGVRAVHVCVVCV